MEKQIQNLMQWVIKQVRTNPYSEVGFSLYVHGGRITRICKQVNIKIQINGEV